MASFCCPPFTSTTPDAVQPTSGTGPDIYLDIDGVLNTTTMPGKLLQCPLLAHTFVHTVIVQAALACIRNYSDASPTCSRSATPRS